jgi:hypothetical protein
MGAFVFGDVAADGEIRVHECSGTRSPVPPNLLAERVGYEEHPSGIDRSAHVPVTSSRNC